MHISPCKILRVQSNNRLLSDNSNPINFVNNPIANKPFKKNLHESFCIHLRHPNIDLSVVLLLLTRSYAEKIQIETI